MSKAILALVAFSFMGLVSVSSYAQVNGDSYDKKHSSYENICRTRVRAMICPTGVCPAGTKDWRQQQQYRCMRHYANVRIRKVGEK